MPGTLCSFASSLWVSFRKGDIVWGFLCFQNSKMMAKERVRLFSLAEWSFPPGLFSCLFLFHCVKTTLLVLPLTSCCLLTFPLLHFSTLRSAVNSLCSVVVWCIIQPHSKIENRFNDWAWLCGILFTRFHVEELTSYQLAQSSNSCSYTLQTWKEIFVVLFQLTAQHTSMNQ